MLGRSYADGTYHKAQGRIMLPCACRARHGGVSFLKGWGEGCVVNTCNLTCATAGCLRVVKPPCKPCSSCIVAYVAGGGLCEGHQVAAAVWVQLQDAADTE